MPTHKTRGTTSVVPIKCTNPNYSGPNHETVIMSIISRDRGISNLLEYEQLREVAMNAKQRFAKLFFTQLNNQGTKINKDWVEKCKVRHSDMFNILARIIDSDEDLELLFVLKDKYGEIKTFKDLNEVRYCPSTFTITGINESSELVDVYEHNSVPKIYGCLMAAMFSIASACREVMNTDEGIFDALSDLALSLLEIGALYNETNPDSKEWRAQEESTLKILTSPPKADQEEEIWELFRMVKRDIEEGKLPYVRELSSAIVSKRRYCHSPFSDGDYYFSSKADSAYIPKFPHHQSIIKSIVEDDPFKGHPFDNAVMYVSHYNITTPDGYLGTLVKTIHIPNSGKYKGRAIHLTLSSIQDRCCYIHNRLFSVLNAIPADCTKDQDKGRNFAIKITSPVYREKHDMNSVLAYDWTNATDSLDSKFQLECLKMVFPQAVVDFWDDISSCEKEFHFKDGEVRKYTQTNGQPQGLLGSFDAFAFAHHIISLMTMKLSGLEMYPQSEFIRILGDDSIISSIECDPTNTVGNNYIRICEFANIITNRSKSTEILNTQKTALVDFAKVTVLNGKYFSPIPFRIANRMGSKEGDYYAFSGALWQSSHGFHKPDLYEDLINHYYKDEEENRLAKLAIFSGILPSFEAVGFSDPVLKEQEDSVRLALCYAINKVKTSLLSSLLGDKIKEDLSLIDKSTDDEYLNCIIPADLQEFWDMIEDPDHKINIAIENNINIEYTIAEILECSQDQAKVISAVLAITEEENNLILDVIELMNTAVEDPDVLMFFKDKIFNIVESLEVLDRLQYRSIYKRSALDSVIMKRSIKTYSQIFGNIQINE